MGLYGKKLHIKKPNGVVQTANLYTDKSDVGNNYLTFRDGGNTVYSILDVNGDIDCKINKNNINYKIKNANFTMPNYQIIQTSNRTSYFTVPNGVNVIVAVFGWDNDSEKSAEEYLKKELKENNVGYIKVTPNKTYVVYNTYIQAIEGGSHESYFGIGKFHQEDIVNGDGGGVPNDPDYYEEYYYPVIIAWSSEINSHATNASAD